MELLDQSGAGYTQLQTTAQQMVAAGNGQSDLAALNTTFRANAPQLFADVDRVKAKNDECTVEQCV